jgi:hypothetical protein
MRRTSVRLKMLLRAYAARAGWNLRVLAARKNEVVPVLRTWHAVAALLLSIARERLDRGDRLERRLRSERPKPPNALVRSILADIDGRERGRLAPTRVRVLGVAATVVVGLAAIGGLGYAATYTTHVVAIITGSQSIASHRASDNAARAQYGTTTATTTTRAAATTTTASTSTTTATTGSGGEAATTAQPGSTGSVSTESPGDTSHPVSATWASDTFAVPTKVTVDPTPTLATGITLKAGSIVVSITATNSSNGSAVTTLAAPLEVVIGNPPSGFVPAVSTDGVNFRALTQISGPPLPADQQDGYFVAADGVHILTRHLTIFGVISKSDLTLSEKGRKLAAPGSGKFGDPTRIHNGAPVFMITKAPAATAGKVTFTFFVDEQAALYFHVLSGTKEAVLTGSSKVRATKLGGTNNRTLHVAVLRPGTIPVTLVLARPPSGKLSIQVSAIDFDGNKVTRTARVH